MENQRIDVIVHVNAGVPKRAGNELLIQLNEKQKILDGIGWFKTRYDTADNMNVGLSVISRLSGPAVTGRSGGILLGQRKVCGIMITLHVCPDLIK